MKENKANTQGRSSFLLPLLAVLLVIAAAAILLLHGHDTGKTTANVGTVKSQVILPGEFLLIDTADITEKASFYPIEVDGTQMEVLAIRASDGTLRTAFNTCQTCYDSGKGFYTQEGDELICNNCGFHFSPDEVEISAGGCNPWPIFAENKTVTDESIAISYDFLRESKEIFAKWKTAVQ